MWGLISLFFGLFLLLITQNVMGGFFTWWPLLILAGGLGSLYQAFWGSKKARFYFHGTFLTTCGILLLVDFHLLKGFTLEHTWPLYFGLVGISLLVYSLRHSLIKRRVTFLIPGSAMIFFSLFFSLFSFNVVQTSFIAFVQGWWPLLFLASGLVLITIALSRSSNESPLETLEEEGDMEGQE